MPHTVMPCRFHGLIAAPFTPLRADGSLNLGVIPDYAEHLARRKISAAFVCGTTGEGASLSVEERESVTKAWIRSDRIPVIVHVGHTSLPDTRRLARHAADHGAVAFSALAPFFFKPRSPAELVDWCAAVASAAPSLPFYYYHIPSMTGVSMPVLEVLKIAADRIPNLAGVKYTHEDLSDFANCLRHEESRFDLLFGRDELLLDGIAAGARGAVGSTYNYASPIYRRLFSAMESGNLALARSLQEQSRAMIAACSSVGVTHLAASKAIMAWLGVDCGPVRTPLHAPSAAGLAALKEAFAGIGFFDQGFGLD